MKAAVIFARIGNRILSILALMLILLMLMYGGYSLWDTFTLYQGAFTDTDLMKFKPTGEDVENPTLKELQDMNPDVRGWITIDDTHIDYPVVQGKTDMEYINKDIYGEFSLSGAIFLDCRNRADFSDQYSLVYGHHMENGAMFGDIAEFEDNSYFQKHTKGTLYLSGITYKIALFACVKTDAQDENIYNPDQWNRENIQILFDSIRKQSVQYREIGITADDSIIGLSTCAETQTNGRIIVFGRLDK